MKGRERLLWLLLVIFALVGGIFAHEHDLRDNCRREGVAHTFSVNITCREMKAKP